MPLFWRIFLLNAVVLIVATALLLGPVTVSTPVLLTEAAVLTVGLAAMLVANALLLRVGLAPLQRLTRAMTTTDLLRPGHRPAVGGRGEIAELITTFNTMLDRLEDERATSSARALSAQESERRRVARELHDEVGQSLTAVLLQLKRAADHAPPGLREELRQAQETTRAGLEEIRRIARRLRPGVLDELGLASALKALATEFGGPGLSVQHCLDGDLPELDRESELVIYRVAQEGLTNTARHARARRAELALRRAPGGVELRVRDDGRGIGAAPEGAGIRGMRERALLVGARLTVDRAADGGTEVRLAVPVPARFPAHALVPVREATPVPVRKSAPAHAPPPP
ncbi:HAMP domain-containing sensor histidine kinase [Streptomyces sp. NPDC057236]|uniref:HAMP domain-containing sensor histidine kinase n=1 Tax=Streptomyces sp. NPDC057236 TaxID=3346059 RepID=UPI00362F5085